MGSNPINLAVRFLLEIAAFVAIGFWGWEQSELWFRFILAFGIPLLAASIWGIFNVPNDPSRSGSAPVVVPGIIRLLIELAIFSLAVWALFSIGKNSLALVMGIVTLIHYVISYDRILWLLKT